MTYKDTVNKVDAIISTAPTGVAPINWKQYERRLGADKVAVFKKFYDNHKFPVFKTAGVSVTDGIFNNIVSSFTHLIRLLSVACRVLMFFPPVCFGNADGGVQ